MKHKFTIALLLSATTLFGQTKPPAKVIVLLPADFNQIMQIVHERRDLSVYDPSLNADQAKQIQISIDAYLRELEKRVKVLDSAKVPTHN